MSAGEANVAYEVRDRVGIVRLDRPAALNALTRPMIAEFRRVVEAAERDEKIGCIAVTGTGRAFCAGIDLGVLEQSTAGNRPQTTRPEDESPALFSHLLNVSKPVIAAINGVAAGGGFVLSMMSDLRFASEDAVFTTVFSKRGLIAEHAMSWILPRQIGTSRALDLLWSSRKVGAEEALRIGLVDRVVPADKLLDAVVDYAAELAANVSPRAVAVIKRQVYDHLSQGFMPASLDCERIMGEALAHPDAREGARSFIERRPPQFKPWAGGEG